MAVRVNGELIPERAILVEMKRLMDFYAQHLSRAELGRQAEMLLRKAKHQAIGTKLLLMEVKRLGIDVPEPDLEAAMQDMIKRSGGDQKLDELLARQNLTRDQLRQSIRAGKQLDMLIKRITSGVPECTEQELREYFERHRERYVTADRAQVRHILAKPVSDSEADKAATRSQLLKLKRQVEEGADFGELAAAHSECPSGKETGGSLGWLSEGTALPEFDQAIFNMDVGDISDVVETPLGYHIIEKLDEEEGEPLPFEVVRERIRDLLMHEHRGRAVSRYVDRLREHAVIQDDDEEGTARGADQIFDSFLDPENGS